jgi:hypothetical protein
MKNNAQCCNCWRRIFRSGSGGTWYHRHNASSSCYPGTGSRKQASPVEVSKS